MPRKPVSRGQCHYCGGTFTRTGMLKHLVLCEERLQAMEAADSGKGFQETLWYLRVQDAYDKDFWLLLEMRGSASLDKLDQYLRAIWLECCGHLSQFTIGGWGGQEIARSRRADDIFELGLVLRHLYDFGTTSETDISAVGSRTGKAMTKHPIVLMARNNQPEMLCNICDRHATHLCLECLYEAEEAGTWFFCEKHAAGHPHDEYGEPIPLVNSPRLGMCGYDGPAEPPY